MNSGPVSCSRLMAAVKTPMPISAWRQRASAAVSSEVRFWDGLAGNIECRILSAPAWLRALATRLLTCLRLNVDIIEGVGASVTLRVGNTHFSTEAPRRQAQHCLEGVSPIGNNCRRQES